MKILFIYDHKYPETWRDGLWAALNLLEKDGFEIVKSNLQTDKKPYNARDYDFVLGWGAFGSPVDRDVRSHTYLNKNKLAPSGLCIAGNAIPPNFEYRYDVLFHETDWYLPQIMSHKNVVHAFGVNTEIYKPMIDAVPVWDWISVGAFADWKRHHLLIDKGGYKLAIGEIQKENLPESMGIISYLLSNGVAISDMTEPETLARIYNSAEKVYIPANINGGGERAVLEARACGRPVEVEYDNPKLKELLKSPVYDEYYYFEQLKKGILSCF